MITIKYKSEFIGETLGTFVLVLFGAYQGLVQIALAWGIGVTLAIYLTRHISCAHLNPAVSISMIVGKRMPLRMLPTYISGQFIGAFLAGITIYILFAPSICNYENIHGIVRGTVESVETAKMFGEFYTNYGSSAIVSMPLAMGAEAFGTFILILLILALTEGCNVGRPDNAIAPLFIGLTVTSIICLIAPLTQAGLNPARDFGPRMVSWIFGWDKAVFPDQSGGFFFVYILAPIVGGALASMFFIKVLEPAMKNATGECGCKVDKPKKY